MSQKGESVNPIRRDTYSVVAYKTHEFKMINTRNPDLPELDEMSVEDLQKQQELLDRRIREKQAAEKKAVIDQIVNVVNTYDIPVDELVEALGGLKIKRKGIKAIQKYQDPATGKTWSGRGKEPSWIKGQDRDKFTIS
jgi:DNA-binding protein H-NS